MNKHSGKGVHTSERESLMYSFKWNSIGLLTIGLAALGIAFASPAAAVSAPDGMPKTRHNVKLPTIKGPKKNPDPQPTSKTVTLRNHGNKTLNGVIEPPNPSQPFTCSTGCGPFSLAPGASTTFSLVFAPVSPGKYKDQLTILTDSSRKPSVPVNMHGKAKQGIPGGPGGGGLPPVDPCSLATTLVGSGSGGSLGGGPDAESLLDSLTNSGGGSLPSLDDLSGSTAGGLPLDQLPVLGEVTSTTNGTLSGLPLSGSAPTLGSLVSDPSTLPVLGLMTSQPSSGDVCQQFNSVLAVTGPAGQAVGVLLNSGGSPLTPPDLSGIESQLSSFASQFTSSDALSQLLSNPSQISGLLTDAQTELLILAVTLAPQVTGAEDQLVQALPASCSPSPDYLSQLQALAPTVPGNVAPQLDQLSDSLPSGGSLSTLPVLGAIVTGGAPQFLPVTLPPTLGTVSGGSSLLGSIPVLGSIPLSTGNTQVDGLVAVIGGTPAQVVAMIPVDGQTGGVPDPSTIIGGLQGGNLCSGFQTVVSSATSQLTSATLSSPLDGQIAGVPGLDAALGTIKTGLGAVIPGL
jgi:hypothetical protein